MNNENDFLLLEAFIKLIVPNNKTDYLLWKSYKYTFLFNLIKPNGRYMYQPL
jgi:hypothetical protein